MPGYFDDLWATSQANPLVARFGASVANQPKVVTSLIGNVYATSLVPTDLTIVAGQGSSPEEILIAAWGACPTATGESLTVAVPFLGSQMFDGFGLSIPSAPNILDTIRIGRTSRTSTRSVLHRQGMKQKRQAFLQDIRPLDGVIVKHYGMYAFVDANGVTHQPPGVRDKVVQLPGVGAHIDNDSIKFDENGRMYADFFGSGGNGGGLTGTGTSVNALKAGDGIQIIPGYAPSDGPTVDIEAAGSVPPGTYKWAFCYVIETKRTPLSPATPGITNIADPTATPPVIAYQEPHLLIPGKPDDVHATALELYRADASVGANGTIQTKFAYTSTPGVLSTDPSAGTTVITSGSYTGMYQYIVLVSHSGVQAGDSLPYNPLCRVQVGDPPIPYDPRDGSLTTLVENGNGTGESIFKTSDGGAFNQITGAITYPEDSPLNHSGFRLLTTLTPSHDPQTYIDTSTDAMLGILFVRDPQVISVKPARYTGQPYPSSVPITGTSPPLYELSGIGFNSTDPLFGNDGVYLRTHEGLVLNEQNNIVPFLAATATLPASGMGATSLTNIPGYQTTMYDMSSLKLYGGDMNLGMYVDIDGTSITRTATGALQAPGGGGSGGGGTGGAGTGAANYGLSTDWSVPFLGFGTTNYVPWNALINGDNVYLDGSHTDGLTIPADGGGDYLISANLWVDSFIHDAQQWSIEYVLSIELWRAGTQVLYIAKEDFYQQEDVDIPWFDVNFDMTAAVTATQPGDVVKIGLQVSGGGPGWRSAVTLYGFTSSPTSGNHQHVTIAPVGVSASSAAARVSLDLSAAPPAMGGNDLPQGSTAIAWGNLDFDTTSGSMWSVGQPTRLVATEAGLYQISAGLAITVYDMDTITIAQGFKMSFQVTSTHGFGWSLGGTKGNAYASSAGDPIICVGSSVGVQLGAGDYVEVYAGTDYTNVTNPATWETSGDEPCWFSLVKCG